MMVAPTNGSSPRTSTPSPRSSPLPAAAGDADHGNPPYTRWAPVAASGGPRAMTPSTWTLVVKSSGSGESEVSFPGTATTSSPERATVVTAAPMVVQEPNSPMNKGLLIAPQEKEDSILEAQAQHSESSSGPGSGNGHGAKKPVWNRQPPRIVNSLESGPVMGAASWPALSESTKASPKLSPSDSSKFPADGSISSSQATGTAPSSSPSPPSSSQKPMIGNSNSNPTPNHGRPTRQKSMKRDGGASVLANGGFSHQLSSHGSAGEASHNTSLKPGSGGVDSSTRDYGHSSSHRETGQRSGNDHQNQRTSSRRGSGGSYSRGDSFPHQNHGGRRDQDRGNHDWNRQRNFNGRDAAMQIPRAYPRDFFTPLPLDSAQFIPPSMIRPIAGPMGIPELQHMYMVATSSIPFLPQPPPVYFQPPDPQLHVKIVNQIDYYFSEENLIRDTYLRQNMDEQGWVPIALIAGFKKVSQLTDNIQFILDALRASTVVEVQGEKIRKRDNWKKWLMPPSVQFPTSSGSLSPRLPSHDMLTARVQSVALDDKTASQSKPRGPVDAAPEMLLRSSSGDLKCQPAISEGTSSSGF
ncbi:hypothetical protein Ancab_003135 [Ancistrocladus abbreviatus]